jgi:hypothetical protein
MRSATGLPFLILLLAFAGGCRKPPPAGQSQGSTTPAWQRSSDDPTLLGKQVVPVRIGELGPNFDACNADGQVIRAPAENARGIAVKAAPFDAAHETGRLPVGANFFVCTRSHDQRWLGIVFEGEGRASAACGVSAPVRVRRDYSGPCRSGWVQSAFVKLSADAPEDPQ